MSKGILVDENLPPSLVGLLKTSELSVFHVTDCSLDNKPDGEIWNYALANDLVILTKDSDFIKLLIMQGRGRVIVLNTGNLRLADLKAFVAQQAETIHHFIASDIPALHIS